MRIIHHHVDVEAEFSVVEANWPHFVQWVLTGHEKLACDEFVCMDAVGGGHIAFEPQAKKMTRVVFELTDPDDGHGGLPLDEIDRRITHDLFVFKDYVEHGGMAARSTRHTPRKPLCAPTRRHKRSDGETAWWTPPTGQRRSGGPERRLTGTAGHDERRPASPAGRELQHPYGPGLGRCALLAASRLRVRCRPPCT